MMDILILRFDAPMMSFGAPVVDEYGKIQPYPSLSMMAGLLANALGYDHSEFDQLEDLQKRLRYASRCDRRGREIQDYQSVRLEANEDDPYYTDDHMDDRHAWTTWGSVEQRSTSSAREIRRRDYWADAVHTVAVTLDPPAEAPTLDDLATAVQHPARPLFLGRKPCLPAGSLFADRLRAENLTDALAHTPLHDRHDDKERHPAWWPTHPDDPEPQKENPDGPVVEDMRQPVTDQRDWENQIHTGERWLAEGTIRVTSNNE
jgi:CRISPR system Cascade subunit CasD